MISADKKQQHLAAFGKVLANFFHVPLCFKLQKTQRLMAGHWEVFIVLFVFSMPSSPFPEV